MLAKSSVHAGFLVFAGLLQVLAGEQKRLLLRLKSLQKVGASNRKRPCVTPGRCSTGAFVVFGVQFFDDLPLPGGQFPDFGGGVRGGEGLLCGFFVDNKCVQRRGYDFANS